MFAVLLSNTAFSLAESPPIIMQQPVDVTAVYGDEVTLRVEAIGPQLGYEWQKRTGKNWFQHQTLGNLESLTISNLGPSHAGTYRVVVSSQGYGSVTSREATISFPSNAGTERIRAVKDAGQAKAGVPVGRGVVLNGRFFYPGFDPAFGVELWVTDGTASGTKRVRDIRAGEENGMIVSTGTAVSLAAYNGRVYFTGDDGENGRALWVSDGTAAGTKILKNNFTFVPLESEGLAPYYVAVQPEETFVLPQALNSFHDLEITDYLVANGVLWFRAASSGVTTLGRTDGTSAGTRSIHPSEWITTFFEYSAGFAAFTEIKSITPGPAPGTVFFVGNSDKNGRELWVSDGTDDGTRLVRSLRPYSADGIVAPVLAARSGKVYFMGQDATSGLEPWVSDGTATGTFRLKDINPGSAHSLAFEFTPYGNHVFFAAQSPSGMGLWKSDGTVAGTEVIKEFLGVSRLRAAATLFGTDRFYFMAREADSGFELWVTDGTTPGTTRVGDIVDGTGSSSPVPLGSDQGSLYFLTELPEDARALWITHGTEAATIRLTETSDYLRYALLRAGNSTFFAGYKTEGGRELQIFKTDGTFSNTILLGVGSTGGKLPDLQWADLGGLKILNTAAITTSDFRTGDLFVTDGNAAGTRRVDLPTLPGAFGGLTPFRGGLLFSAMVNSEEAGVFRVDGLDLRPLKIFSADGARARAAASSTRALFLFDTDSSIGNAIHTDGTFEGTKLLNLRGAYGLNAGGIGVHGETFLLANSPGLDPETQLPSNAELYLINAAGTVSLVKDLNPAYTGDGRPKSSYPAFLTRLGSDMHFFTMSPEALWRTDGTAAGTVLVEQLSLPGFWIGSENFEHRRPGILGGRFYFSAGLPRLYPTLYDDWSSELWESDGTAWSTVLLREIYPGSYLSTGGIFPTVGHMSSLPDQFTQVGNILFFAATSAQGRELWKTDGNTSGTQLVRDLSTGDEEQYDSSFGFSGFFDAEFPPSVPAFNKTNPTNLVAVAGKLYFVARDDEGIKLYRSDGTASGTVPIEVQRVGYGSPRELSECNGRLYYVRSRLGFPGQIWEYNPATDVHREVTSLERGVANPAQLTVSDGRLYFVGDDGDGQKLLVYERLPIIKEHPASQTLLAGGSATLGVVTYDPTVTYAWRRGVGTGVPVGAGPTLSVSASNVTIQPYFVRVTNGREGSQRSGNAYIRVLDAIFSAQIRNFPESWWALTGADPGTNGSVIPGTLDLSWGTSNMVNGVVSKIINLPDGKILIGGQFSEVRGMTAHNLARLNHDGTFDATFSVAAGPAGGITDMAASADGKIYISGNFVTVDGYQRERIARLHPDGAIDLAFVTPIAQTGIQQALTVLPTSNGKVFLGGQFEAWGGHPTVSLVRLNSDGTVDSSFTVSNQPNTGGPFRIATLAFYPSDDDPQQLLVGGGTYFVEPGDGTANQRRHVARLSATTGAWDPSFNTSPVPNPPASLDGSVSKIVVLPDGKILVAGIQGGGHTTFDGMVRLNANGSLDSTFQTGPTTSSFGPSIAAGPFNSIALLDSGRIAAGGRFSSVQGAARSNIVQLLPNGQRDPAFVPGEGPNNDVRVLEAQTGGGILIAGPFTKVNGVDRRGLARIHGNPAPPSLLHENLPVLDLDSASSSYALDVKLSVKVLGWPPPEVTWFLNDSPIGSGPVLTVSKTNSDSEGTYYAMINNSAGAIQTEPLLLSFVNGPPAIVTQPLNARATLLGTARFNVEARGSLPISYQWKRNGEPINGETGSSLSVRAITYEHFDDLFTVEIRNSLGTVESTPARMLLSRLGTRNLCFYHYTLPAGINDNPPFTVCSVPTSFDFPGYTDARSVAYQPGGFVVIGGGAFTTGSRWSDRITPYLMRFTEWGVRAYDGEGRPDAIVHLVATAPDGSVYISGDFKNVLREDGSHLAARPGFAKYDSQMKFVPNFAPALLPTNAQVTAILPQPDGKLLIAGTFSNVNGVAMLGIARVLPNGQNDPAFQSGLTYMNYAKPMALALQSNGKILLGGQGAYYGAGAPPAGEFRNQLCRLNSDGSWDSSFETAGGTANAGDVHHVAKIVVQPDDRILISGFLSRWGSTPRNGIARLQPDGALDPSFDPQGGSPDGSISSMALLPSGEILVTGNFGTFAGEARRGLVRLRSDGSLDHGYYPPQMNGGRDIVATPDGGAILVGSFNSGPFTPPTGEPEVSTREWVHPRTGSTHQLHTYLFESQCEGHLGEIGHVPGSGDICGVAHSWLNGIMRLHGTEDAPQPPVITLQPVGHQSLVEGGIATLFAGASGEDLSYQWQKDGQILPNETKPVLFLDALTASKSGNYSVIISNGLGTVMSQEAVVTVVAGTSPVGSLRLSADRRKVEWSFKPASGRAFTTNDIQNFTLQVSEDLRTWNTIPGAVQLRDGDLVFTDEQAAAKQKRFYRLVSGYVPPFPSATADPGTQIPLSSVPESTRALAQEHITAFLGEPRSRGAEELNWSNVTFAEEARQIFDPGYKNGSEPAYVELRVVAAGNPSIGRGYIIVSLTEEDFPIVEFGTRGPTKTDQVLRSIDSGVIKKFMRFGPGYIVGENSDGQRLTSLGTMPMRIVGELPNDGVYRYASFDSITGQRTAPPRSRANLAAFPTYEELRNDFQTNPMRREMRTLRKVEAAARWKLARREFNPAVRLSPASSQDVLTSDVFASARVELDDYETSPVQVEVLRNGGLRLTALQRGSAVLRTRTADGKVAFHSVNVAPPDTAQNLSAFGNCWEIKTHDWQAGGGWDTDQRKYYQMQNDDWCPKVGCGPTALAMLFGWWDSQGVPSAFYRLKSGQGNAWSFRFDFDSLFNQDAGQFIANSSEQPYLDVFNDLHGLCNVMCDPFGSSGATYPDQLESAFWEYSLRVADVPNFDWPAPMNEFGEDFVGVLADSSWVPPGGMTDWEGGGTLVANGIKEGRPGIIGIGLCLCDPPHYALAFGYKRMTAYVGCNDPEAVETRRFFLVNMGFGSGNPPEWHIAEDVWFGLTAQFWQNKLPEKKTVVDNVPGQIFTGFLGSGPKYEVRRPTLARMTSHSEKIVLLESDNHGHTPTPFTRLRSLNSGATFTVAAAPIGSGLFKSGAAAVSALDGQQIHAFGLGTDQRLWRATSLDGGITWANAWIQFSPPRAYDSAPAAAASGGAVTIYVAARGADNAYYVLRSANSGLTWSGERYLGGSFRSAPALTVSFDGETAHIFGLGHDQRIWRAFTVDSGTNWFGWYPVGDGVFNSAPAAAMALGKNTMHVFARGTDNHYWRYLSVNAGVTWQGPFQVPNGVWTSGPSISIDAAGSTIRLFGRGTEPTLPPNVLPNPADPRIYMGVSSDGGVTWPGAFSPVVPLGE